MNFLKWFKYYLTYAATYFLKLKQIPTLITNTRSIEKTNKNYFFQKENLCGIEMKNYSK
jgi:hypothetical protein